MQVLGNENIAAENQHIGTLSVEESDVIKFQVQIRR
jgi:hypothetical protein